MELAGITDPARAKAIVERSAFLEWRLTDMDNLFRDALPAVDRALVQAGVTSAAEVGQPSALEQLLGADTSDTEGTADSAASDTTSMLDQPGPLSTLLFNGAIPGEFLVAEEDFPRVDSLIRLEEVQRVMPRSVERRPIITGGEMQDARATIDQTNNQSIVLFTLTRSGGRRFRQETRQHVGDFMAIILDGRVFRQPPVLRSEIGREGQIELGSANIQEAQDLALVLRAGALPAPLEIVEERTVGPSLGRDSIRQGRNAGIIAGVLVILVMIGYYRTAGLLAVLGLCFYALFTIGGLASFGATLTLPGLAGFVLSLGMAVDANVLIFERIREELKLNKSPRLAVDAGFNAAMPAIIDANVTTVITAAFLFQFGTGPVKGFAVTLIVGILASLITAVFVTKTFFLMWLQRSTAAKELSI